MTNTLPGIALLQIDRLDGSRLPVALQLVLDTNSSGECSLLMCATAEDWSAEYVKLNISDSQAASVGVNLDLQNSILEQEKADFDPTRFAFGRAEIASANREIDEMCAIFPKGRPAGLPPLIPAS